MDKKIKWSDVDKKIIEQLDNAEMTKALVCELINGEYYFTIEKTIKMIDYLRSEAYTDYIIHTKA